MAPTRARRVTPCGPATAQGGFRSDLDALRWWCQDQWTVDDPARSPSPGPIVPALSADPDLAAGSSHEQRAAEGVMLALLSDVLGTRLQPKRLPLPNGSRIELDGASEDLSVLVEAWAHQGPPKAAQTSKIAKDALKLALAARVLGGERRLILLFSDAAAAAPFTRSGWIAGALREFGIEVQTVELPAGVRETILVAQRRQYR
jgi:hypothetical protein